MIKKFFIIKNNADKEICYLYVPRKRVDGFRLKGQYKFEDLTDDFRELTDGESYYLYKFLGDISPNALKEEFANFLNSKLNPNTFNSFQDAITFFEEIKTRISFLSLIHEQNGYCWIIFEIPKINKICKAFDIKELQDDDPFNIPKDDLYDAGIAEGLNLNVIITLNTMLFDYKTVKSVSDFLPLVYASNAYRYLEVLKSLNKQIPSSIPDSNFENLVKTIPELKLKNSKIISYAKKELQKKNQNNDVYIKLIDNICENIESTTHSLDTLKLLNISNNKNDKLYEQQIRKRNDLTFYRGVGDIKYGLLPKVLRQNFAENEFDLYHEFAYRFANMFQSNSYFKNLTQMQHFELPTRLLDITTNPLIALYMACSTEFSTNNKIEETKIGEVIFFFPEYDSTTGSNQVKYYDNNKIQLLAALSQLDEKSKTLLTYAVSITNESNIPSEDINRFFRNKPNDSSINTAFLKKYSLDSYGQRFLDAYNKLLDIANKSEGFCKDQVKFKDLSKCYYVKPLIVNERMSAQSACFILFGLDNDYADKKLVTSRNCNDFYRILIAPKYKKTILTELENLNIHQATITPDMDNVSKYLVKKINS